jgi:hypothetical protein
VRTVRASERARERERERARGVGWWGALPLKRTFAARATAAPASQAAAAQLKVVTAAEGRLQVCGTAEGPRTSPGSLWASRFTRHTVHGGGHRHGHGAGDGGWRAQGRGHMLWSRALYQYSGAEWTLWTMPSGCGCISICTRCRARDRFDHRSSLGRGSWAVG